MDQKTIFQKTEGDEWYKRNHKKKINFNKEPVVNEIKKIFTSKNYPYKKIKLLEIGCSDGKKLRFLNKKFGCEVFGVEPSKKAYLKGISNNIYIKNTTADNTEFRSNFFDIVIFGFFLYLVDKKYIKKIFVEADRILKKKGWLIIHDFYSINPKKIKYFYNRNVCTFKDDYSKLFLKNNKNYIEYSKKVFDFHSKEYTDIESNWETISVLRKIK